MATRCSQTNDQLSKLFAGISSMLTLTNKETPLHRAVLNSNLEVAMMIARALIKSKVDINLPNKRGETPFHFAVRMNKEALITLLVERGAGNKLWMSNK